MPDKQSDVLSFTLADTVEGMLSENFKERFVAEYKQLEYRYIKLKHVVDNFGQNTFLETCVKELLEKQLTAMKTYLDVLKHRATVESVELELNTHNPTSNKIERSEMFKYYRGKAINDDDVYGYHVKGTWIYGTIIPTTDDTIVIKPNYSEVGVIVDPKTVSKATGVFDEDLIEVYEGDTIRVLGVDDLFVVEYVHDPVDAWCIKNIKDSNVTFLLSYFANNKIRFNVIGTIWDKQVND